MDLSIIILAAGQGTRMKSTLPKVLHPLAGKPMLQHVIDTAKSLLPQRIIIVTGYEGQALKAAIQDETLYFVEQIPQCGTAHAVGKALEVLNTQRTLILYGDVPLISTFTLQRLLTNTKETNLGLVTTQMEDPTGFGRIVKDNNQRIKKIVEQKDANEKEQGIKEVNSGIYVLPVIKLKEWLPKINNNNQQKEYYLTDIIPLAIQDKVEIDTISPWEANEVLGINDRSQLAQVERCFQEKLAQELMKEGVTIYDPKRFDVRGTLHAQPDVVIDVNVVFIGEVTLGKGCNIGPNCVLIDCELGENVSLLANSYLENVKISHHATIGPFARLRPGTILEEGVRVGNFVEIKNTHVGMNTKINHLSYIGDAVIGKEVNIGAGTITCNYDGANKHQTIIEDNVMIGSDTQLIAPILVGEGATIGAGSTLSKDVPAQHLTLTHQLNQRSQKWERPKKLAKNEQER